MFNFFSIANLILLLIAIPTLFFVLPMLISVASSLIILFALIILLGSVFSILELKKNNWKMSGGSFFQKVKLFAPFLNLIIVLAIWIIN